MVVGRVALEPLPSRADEVDHGRERVEGRRDPQATLLARRFITEMEVVEQWPDTGTSHGEFPEVPGFFWEREVSDTDLATVRRVVLHVYWDERNPNACELIYFIRDRREPDDGQQ